MHTKFRSEILKGRDNSKDLWVDGDNIRMDLREIVWEIVAHVTENRDQWRSTANTSVDIFVPKTRGSFFINEVTISERTLLHGDNCKGDIRSSYEFRF
jgi:hypothetical protein